MVTIICIIEYGALGIFFLVKIVNRIIQKRFSYCRCRFVTGEEAIEQLLTRNDYHVCMTIIESIFLKIAESTFFFSVNLYESPHLRSGF